MDAEPPDPDVVGAEDVVADVVEVSDDGADTFVTLAVDDDVVVVVDAGVLVDVEATGEPEPANAAVTAPLATTAPRPVATVARRSRRQVRSRSRMASLRCVLVMHPGSRCRLRPGWPSAVYPL